MCLDALETQDINFATWHWWSSLVGDVIVPESRQGLRLQLEHMKCSTKKDLLVGRSVFCTCYKQSKFWLVQRYAQKWVGKEVHITQTALQEQFTAVWGV